MIADGHGRRELEPRGRTTWTISTTGTTRHAYSASAAAGIAATATHLYDSGNSYSSSVK